MRYYVAKPLKATNGRYCPTPSLNSNILFVHKVFYGFPICRIELELCYDIHGGNIPSEWLVRLKISAMYKDSHKLLLMLQHRTHHNT